MYFSDKEKTGETDSAEEPKSIHGLWKSGCTQKVNHWQCDSFGAGGSHQNYLCCRFRNAYDGIDVAGRTFLLSAIVHYMYVLVKQDFSLICFGTKKSDLAPGRG